MNSDTDYRFHGHEKLFNAAFDRLINGALAGRYYWWGINKGSFKRDTLDNPDCPFVVFFAAVVGKDLNVEKGSFLIRSKPIVGELSWECSLEMENYVIQRGEWDGNERLMEEHLTLALMADWLD